MTFEVAAEAYDRFMGRYSQQLSPQLADLAGVRAGQRVLDVGCGPGALTAELVGRVGERAVSAVDPSEAFVAAAGARYPGVDVQRASAEDLPFEDDAFDVALAQLVVHFMTDPVAGLREMRRVTSSGGAVAACVWDHLGERTPLAVFWQAARELDPDARDESDLPGAREGHLGELLAEAGLASVEETSFEATARFASFDDWWELFALGVGPAGTYAQTRDGESRERLRARCQELLPAAPFTLSTWAWAARGVA
ncbi:MAG: class I SAM-dependent methyltransferase [Gaiellaceae bacterium]